MTVQVESKAWERARLARDARFDGRFFIGVTSTGIYCRPICPAPSPKESNVRYFRTAAGAAEAGFRPCLRCRPEASPGTPAWIGSPSTVSRGLKLISQSALDDDNVEELAARLGVGSRHLRRLFVRYLGASPIAIAQTRRVHFAKKLIDETALPMTEVALAAGFGSVRRFNTTFRTLYGRTPSELRRAVKKTTPAGSYRFQLAFRPPFDWPAMLRFLTPRATPGVEMATPDEYRRTISLDGKQGEIAVRLSPHRDALDLAITFPEPAALFRIVERVRRMFDLAADPQVINHALSKNALLRPLVRRSPGLRVPGCWDGFEVAVRAILGQHVSVAFATILAGRLVSAFGEPTAHGLVFPTPQSLAQADLTGIGLTTARARTICDLARETAEGRICFEHWNGPEEIQTGLTKIRGIGPWTAQYIAMRLGEPDAFPSGDLHLKEFAAQAAQWSPWRAYAAMHLWSC